MPETKNETPLEVIEGEGAEVEAPSNVAVKVRASATKGGKQTVHVVEADGALRCKTRYAADRLGEVQDGTMAAVTCRKCRNEKRTRAAEPSSDPRSDDRIGQLRFAVRFAYDIQHMRISQGNRSGPQAEHAPAKLDEAQKEFLAAASARLLLIEQDAFAEVKRLLKGVPIYEQWLKDQKGVGPTIAGVIVANIDIRKSETCAGLWALCGLSVDGAVQYLTVQNARHVTVRAALTDEQLEHLTIAEQGADVVMTSTIPGGLFDVMKHLRARAPAETQMRIWSGPGEAQRRRKGEKAGFNPWLKAKMLEVLGGSLLKARNETYTKLYRDYRDRKLQQVGDCMLCNGTKVYDKKPCGNCEGTGRAAWGKSDAHRHRAALRYMVKMFLRELWTTWRTLENLPVRPPYEEQYLGIVHHTRRSA